MTNKYLHLKKEISLNKLSRFILPLFLLIVSPFIIYSQTADITGPSNFNDCQQQTMTVTIVNNGTLTATNVVVDYFYLSGFSYVAGTSLITYPTPPNDTTDPGDNGSRLRWTLTRDINPGETVTITFDLITNCVAQSGTHNVIVTYDPGAQTTSDTTNLTVNHGALTVTKTPTVTNAFVGDTVSWTLNIRSTGFGPAVNIEISDTLGSGFTFISSTMPGGGLNYTHPSLASGSELNYTVTARINSCINLDDTMFVSWGCGGGVYCQQNLYSSASINLTVREPELQFVSITPNPINFSFCQAETVTVTLQNNGTGTAFDPIITPNLPAGYQVTNTTVPVVWTGTYWDLPNITSGSMLTFSFDLTTNDYCTLSNGVILFDADAYNECGNLFTAPQIQINTANPRTDFPSLSVSKTAPIEIEVGETINYTISVSYSGNPSYSGDVTIVDQVPNGLTAQNITGGGVYNPGANTITWIIPQANVINGVILSASFDSPTYSTYPELCDYCFNTFTNNVTASTSLTCPLTPGGLCDISASASAMTRVNCRDLSGTDTVTGAKDAPVNDTENCTTLAYTLTFTFGNDITDSWSDISLQEMMNNGQTAIGNATFTVGAVSVVRPVPADGDWGLLSFLDTAGAPGPAGQTLTVTFSLYQNNTGSFYNDAVLTVPSLGGGICGTGNQQVLVTEYMNVEESTGAIDLSAPAFLDQCETITVTMDISKGTYNLFNPVVIFLSSDYTYIPGSASWNGDGVNFPTGSIEPTIVGNTLTWDNSHFGLPYFDAGADRYYAFQNGGRVTMQLSKTSSCSTLPNGTAELYFDNNCQRLGRSGNPSTNLKSSDSESPWILSKGNLVIRKFPELVTATSDTVSFTITVVNSGDGKTYNTVFTDILGPDLLFDPSYTGPASLNPDTVDGNPYNPAITGRLLVFNLGDLNPNQVVLVTIPARLVGCDEADLTNTAEATWGCGGSPSDCQALPVSRTVNVNLQESNLLIRGSGDVYICEQNMLTLDILNSGRTMDYDVQAVFIIPAGLSYVAGSSLVNGTISAEPVQVGNELIWNFNNYAAGLGDLDPDEMLTLTFDIITDCDLSSNVDFQAYGRYVAPCDHYVGNITNTVNYILDITNNRANLVVTKQPSSQTAEQNDDVTWTISIRNSGQGTAFNLEFYDALPANVSIPAAPGYGIQNERLNGVPQPVFDDGLPPTNLGTAAAPRTLIDLAPGSTIAFELVARVDTCTATAVQNRTNARWGCNNGCRFNYNEGSADLLTSPAIAIINHQVSSLSICGALFSFQVQNTGSTATSVVLDDTLPAGWVYPAGTATISSDYVPPRGDLVAEPSGAGTGNIQWDSTNIPLIYPGETITITFLAINNVAAGNCTMPINGINSISMTYENSCSDALGPTTSTLAVQANQPNFTIDIQPDTQVLPSGTPVCWNVTVNNGAGGDIVNSLDIEFTFGPDYNVATITAPNGSDGTVPVIAGNVVRYNDVTVNENSTWTAFNICAQAIANPDVSQLWVSATATGECSSGCFYGTASDSSSSAIGDIVKTVNTPTATIGEDVIYTITVDYDGASSNYQNVTITDTLPPNVSFVSQVSYTGPNAPVAPVCAAGVCTWNVGNFVSSPTGEQSVIVFTARVDNVAGNQNGDIRTNTARATYIVNGYNYDDSDTVDFTIVEPELTLAKTRTSAATGDAGDTVSYRLVVNHLGTSTATAYDVVVQETVPAFMTYTAGSQASVPPADSFTQVGNTLQWTYNSFPIGTTATITYDVTVNDNVEPYQVITNTAQTTWTSLAADAEPNERNGSGGVNDYISTSSANFTINFPTVTKILNTGVTTHTILSSIPYRITINMIEGHIDNLLVRDNMPDFLIIDLASIVVTPAWPYTQTITGPNNGTATTFITWDFGNVDNPDPGQNIVIDCNLIVADVAANDDGDTFQNLGRLLYTDFNGVARNISQLSALITIRVPALVTDKSITAVNGGAPTATVAPGDIITYQYTVTNVGTGVANSVNITDTFPNTYLEFVSGSARLGVVSIADPTGLPGPNLNFNLAETINGGATITLTFDARVLSTVSSGTVINNTSFATGRDLIDNPIPADNRDHVAGDTDLDDQDSVSITAVIPALVVDKSVLLVNGAAPTGFIEPGDTIRYQVTIQNVGGARAYNVDLTDTLPGPDFTYVAGSSTLDGAGIADPSIAGNTLTWDLNTNIDGGNPVGSTRTITFDVTVGSGIHQGTVYTNTASAVNGLDGAGSGIPPNTSEPDDTDIDDTDTADLTGREPALVTDKIVFQVNGGAPSGVPPFVAVNDVVTFRYTVTNVGGGTAYNLDLTDILPNGFTYQAGSTSITWPTGSYTVDPAIAGNTLTWNSSAQLAGGEVLTLTFNATVTNNAFIPIPPSGQFENIASATADDGAGNPVPADNSADIPADTDLDDTDNAFMQPADPALIVDKSVVSVNGDPLRIFTEPGDTVLYRVTIQNVGGAPALSIDLQDTIDATTIYQMGSTNASWNGSFSGSHNANPSIAGSVLTWDSSLILGGNGIVLSPSATVTYEFDVYVTTAVTQGGTILNTGIGSGVDGAGTPIPANNSASVPADTDLDDTDSVTLPTYKPGLVTDKTVALINGAPSTGFIEPGNVITYQYTIQNVGQAVAYNVDITDTLPGADFAYVAGTSTLDGVPIADPTIVGNDLTWDTNSTIAGGNPTGATITLRFNITVGSGIHQSTVYTNTNWAVNGTDGDGGAIALASTDAEDTDLDDSDAVDLTGREPALVTDKVVSLVNGAVPGSFPPIVAPGDLVTFQYTVTNVGAGTAYNVDLTDILPNGYTYQTGSTNVIWPSGSYTADPTIAGVNLSWDSSAQLSGGQSLTLTFTTLVTNDAYRPLPAGNWINTASATGDDGAGTQILADNSTDVPADTDLDDTDTADLIPAQPALVVDKTVVSVNGVPGETYVQPGDYIRYRFTVTNVGRGLAFNVDVDDTLDIGLTYDTVIVPPTTTTASWTGDFGGSHIANPQMTGTPITGINLLWDSSLILGTADGIILSSGAILTMEYDIYVTSFIVQGTPVDNLAHSVAIDGRSLPVPADNSAPVPADTDLDDTDGTTLFTEEPALIVTKNTNKAIVSPGEVVRFTITVQNVGLGDALQLQLRDTLPACFSYVPNSTRVSWPSDPADAVASPWNHNPSISGQYLTFNIGATLNGGDPVGEALTMTFDALVGSGCPTQIINSVLARGVDGYGNPIVLGGVDPDDTDPDDADNAQMTVLTPLLEIIKSIVLINGASPSMTVKTGDIITYEIKLSNPGLAPLVRLLISDTTPYPEFEYIAGSSAYNGSFIPDPVINGKILEYDLAYTLNAGETATLRFSMKVTDKITNEAVYTNCADAKGYDSAMGIIETKESCVDITAYIPPSDGDIDKLTCNVTTSGLNNRLCAGDLSTLCITIVNGDNLPINSPVLNFELPVGIDLIPGTFVLDGVSVPDPTVTGRSVEFNLPDISALGTNVLCFQIIATANASLGRQEFNFSITDRLGRTANCSTANIITVDDCKETACGYLEKLNYPVHRCYRLVSLIEPLYDTASAMYTVGSFYKFVASNPVKRTSSTYLEADYDNLWKFRLFDIAEKNLDALTMHGGVSAFSKDENNNLLHIIYDSATPYFTRSGSGEAKFWTSTVSDRISTKALGFTLFAKAERMITLQEKSAYLLNKQFLEGGFADEISQMTAELRILNTLLEQSKTVSPESSIISLPRLAKQVKKDSKIQYEIIEFADNDIETPASILLGSAKFIRASQTYADKPSSSKQELAEPMRIAENAGNKAYEALKSQLVLILKPKSAISGKETKSGAYNDRKSLIKEMAIAIEALNEWRQTGTSAKNKAIELIKTAAEYILDNQQSDGSFMFNQGLPNFLDQASALHILSIAREALSNTEYEDEILKGYTYLEKGLWNDKFGLYRTGTSESAFYYTPDQIGLYLQNYLDSGRTIEASGALPANSRFSRFLDMTLNNGGMQLDDTWRRNENLHITAGSTLPKAGIYAVPVDMQLIPVLNSRLEFIDPMAEPPKSLIELDGKNLIQLESLSCNASYATPSQKMFVTDIGNVALAELYNAATAYFAYTYPTYLIGKMPNTAWILARKMGEYALYNSFTLDYASRSGIDLRFSRTIIPEPSIDLKSAEARVREILSHSMLSQQAGIDITGIEIFRPIFVLFGTALPGADRSIREQVIINPKLLGYNEDRRIFLSDAGQNLARLAAEYEFLTIQRSENSAVAPVVKFQMTALYEFLKGRFLSGSESKSDIPMYLYPSINSSGEPLGYTQSEESADLFSCLSALDGMLMYYNTPGIEKSTDVKSLVNEITNIIIKQFHNPSTGLFRNSVKDDDLSTVNIFYLNRLLSRALPLTGNSKLLKSITLSIPQLLKEKIIKSIDNVAVSINGKPGKISSIVDINTVPAAAFTAVRTALDIYNETKNIEWLNTARELWKAQLDKGYDVNLKVFKGSRTPEERLRERIVYQYNSFDIGMIIGAAAEIIPYLDDEAKIDSFERLSVFFDKIIEKAEVQYLPFKDRTPIVKGELSLLPGLRTEVTIKYDYEKEIPGGAYPGDTVKFILRFQNRCSSTVGDISTIDKQFEFIEVTDLLPPEFSYIKDSTYINGVKGPEPRGETELYWQLKGLTGEGLLILTFLAEVDHSAKAGSYVNYAKMGYVPVDFGTAYVAPSGWAESTVYVLDASTLNIKFFEDSNSNGIRDEGENDHLIPSYTLLLDMTIPATSTKEGVFLPLPLKPGYHHLEMPSINPDTYWWLGIENPLNFHSRIEEPATVEVPLIYRRVIEGYVYNDKNNNGVFDMQQGEGVKNVELETTAGQPVISGDEGYFYYISHSPEESIKLNQSQKFTEIQKLEIHLKEK